MIPGIFRNCKSVPFPLPPACLPALLLWPPPLCSTARHTGPARGHLLLALASHASRQSCRRSSTPHAGASSLCHAPEPPTGRHLAAVMAGSLQHPRTPTRACTSTQSTTSFYSTLSFAASSPPDSRTPPAITIATAEQGLAVEPPP